MSQTRGGNNGQLTLDRPEWRWEYDLPVVETAKNNHRSTLHWPDETADEPRPACEDGGYGVSSASSDVEWTAKELTGGLAAFRRPCTDGRCLQRLARAARQLEVEFDG